MTIHDDPNPLDGAALAVPTPRVARDGAPLVVAVHAADPLSRAGVVHLLAAEPRIALLLPDDAAAATADAAVSVFVAGRLDEATTVEVRRCARRVDHDVVLVAEPLREPELMAVLECGVRNILRRDEVTRDELVAAVRAAARHESRLPPDLLSQLMAHVGRANRAVHHAYASGQLSVGLAPREIEVLGLLAEGLETRDIATKLAYSERTIKNVIYGLTTRLRLRNRTHAVAYAFREGYL